MSANSLPPMELFTRLGADITALTTERARELIAPDFVLTEVAGHPYGGPCSGPEEFVARMSRIRGFEHACRFAMDCLMADDSANVTRPTPSRCCIPRNPEGRLSREHCPLLGIRSAEGIARGRGPVTERPGIWRSAKATKMSVIVDAEDYFDKARSAMLAARKRIMLIGWDFDARIKLVNKGRLPGEPEAVGDFIYWLVERNPDLEVYLLRWDVGGIKSAMRGSNLLAILRWMRHPRIFTKLDSKHPTGASHHQKIVVIDDCLAFCGGIDMTCERWDTREHFDDDPKRVVADGTPYQPWHDATSALQGPIAAELGELARMRWHHAGGKSIEGVDNAHDLWPDDLEAHFNDIEVSIARTRPEMTDLDEVREIEALFVRQIAEAKTSIYAESQYFASRKIAEAMAARLAEPDGPEIVIVNPVAAEGWLEPVAMDTARARLFAALKQRDKHDRLRMYHPHTKGGEPIYVHAKIMIVDGHTLRIGSANMNNRSLGLDTECDVTIAASGEQAQTVRAIRDGLIAEHLGVRPERVASEIDARGSIIAAIDHLRGNGRTLKPYRIPNLTSIEAWLADNEILDPESPSEMFESTAKRSLFKRLRHPFQRF